MMNGEEGVFGRILIAAGKITGQQLADASRAVEGSDSTLDQELVRRGWVTDEDVARAHAEEFGMEIFADLSGYRLPKEIYQSLPYAFVSKQLIVPFEEREGTIMVAVSDPLNLQAVEEMRFRLGRPITTVYSPRTAIAARIAQCYELEQGAAGQLLANMAGSEEGAGEGDVQVYDLLDSGKGQPPIVRLLNVILTEAIQQGASDIHFEPYEDQLQVRYRIDGVLQKRHSPPPEYANQIITRIKVMSKLDIAERRLPQDGRIKLKMGSREIDFRVSTVPVSGGERIVLRILDKGNVILGLHQMGMPEHMLSLFNTLIHLSEGIILVTGPTGSGKTTTLYSAICELQGSETNIMTIEDPVEYNLKGIAQIGVRPQIGLSFASGLRHILRQDPDVIMVGEIRDAETAEIAIQSSLTGHLVLSTLHTNDAPSSVTRLVDMGIEPYLISSTLVGVLAQRLVRRICSDCKEAYDPTEQELEQMGLPSGSGPFYRGKGCDQCYDTGYRGRHGVYELMVVDGRVQQQIVKSADAATLRRIALKQGMCTLRDHGAQLVADGITTTSEVLRVTRVVHVDEEA